MSWISRLFCKHEWKFVELNKGFYDYESWYKCTKCGKEKD